MNTQVTRYQWRPGDVKYAWWRSTLRKLVTSGEPSCESPDIAIAVAQQEMCLSDAYQRTFRILANFKAERADATIRDEAIAIQELLLETLRPAFRLASLDAFDENTEEVRIQYWRGRAKLLCDNLRQQILALPEVEFAELELLDETTTDAVVKEYYFHSSDLRIEGKRPKESCHLEKINCLLEPRGYRITRDGLRKSRKRLGLSSDRLKKGTKQFSFRDYDAQTIDDPGERLVREENEAKKDAERIAAQRAAQ